MTHAWAAITGGYTVEIAIPWTNVTAPGGLAATHATVRYSIPDGQTGTLGLYVDGVWKVNLPLTSTRMRASKNQVPGGVARFFDDVMVSVRGGIPAGATVKLQKDVTGTVAYTIDFLEVETAAAPILLSSLPGTWVTVSGSDGAAIQAAINTANSGSKNVWMPAGTYTVTGTITVPPGVQVRGAGMWHTRINRNNILKNARLFELQGSNTMKDFKVVSNLTTYISQNCVFRGDAVSGNTIEGVWAEYVSLYLGFSPTNTVIRGNRVRNAYKDSIHFARNAVNNLAENNTIRNSGDDCTASALTTRSSHSNRRASISG